MILLLVFEFRSNWTKTNGLQSGVFNSFNFFLCNSIRKFCFSFAVILNFSLIENRLNSRRFFFESSDEKPS